MKSGTYLFDKNQLSIERLNVINELFEEYQTEKLLYNDLELFSFTALYVTSKCHLSCIHCSSEKAYKGINKDYPTEEIIKVINKLSIFSEKVQLTGGEIMIRKDPVSRKNDILLLLKEIKRREREPVFQTTGMQLDDEVIANLQQTGIEWVSLSLDGGSVEYSNKIRKNSDAFTKVIEVIPKIKKAGLKVKIGSVITPLNYNEDDFRLLGNILCDLEVDNWKLYQFFPRETGRASFDNQTSLEMDNNTFQNISKKIILEFQEKIKKITIHSLSQWQNAPAFLVHPSGNLFIHIGNEDHDLGNVLTMPLKELINKMEHFRKQNIHGCAKTYYDSIIK